MVKSPTSSLSLVSASGCFTISHIMMDIVIAVDSIPATKNVNMSSIISSNVTPGFINKLAERFKHNIFNKYLVQLLLHIIYT